MLLWYSLGSLHWYTSAVANRLLFLTILCVHLYFLFSESAFPSRSTFLAPLGSSYSDLLFSLLSKFIASLLYGWSTLYHLVFILFTSLRFNFICSLPSAHISPLLSIHICSVQLCPLNYFSLYSVLLYKLVSLGSSLYFTPLYLIFLKINYHCSTFLILLACTLT